jgi:O-succinylbenzoate synthase
LPGDISASDRYYTRDITNENFVLNSDSTIDVPRGAGLGVTINESAMKQYSLSELSFKAE